MLQSSLGLWAIERESAWKKLKDGESSTWSAAWGASEGPTLAITFLSVDHSDPGVGREVFGGKVRTLNSKLGM